MSSLGERGAAVTGEGASPAASRRLARAVASTSWRELPAGLRRQAVDLFVDTLAVIAAGSVHSEFAPWVAQQGRERGECTALGLAQGVPAATAALLNGGATTVLQWQDGHRLARGHPASHLVPVLFALGERLDASAEALMSAFVGGYEAGTRIGIALGGLRAPLHDGGSWATLGAAAAGARLLGGDAAAIATALESAATLAPLGWRDTVSRGTTVHHLFIGVGATTALATAQSACAGLDAIPGTIEAFFGPRAGAAFDATRLCDGLDAQDRWSRFELAAAYFKWHPVCAHFSGLADALAQLQDEQLAATGRAFGHDDVARVEVATYRTALDYDAAQPASELAARFSAAAICYAALDPAGLEGAALGRTASDPAARRWMQRVEVAHDPALDAGYPAGRPARVTLHLAAGGARRAEVCDVRGDRARPLSAAERADKAHRALALAFGPRGAMAVRKALDDYFDARARIGDLAAALRAAHSHRRDL